MKKKIYPMLFVAALSLSACTEVLEPNVDYGGNTFINDYSALVDAVNNLNKTLQERFDALNQLLKSNMVDIKLAIDSNTGAIKVLSEKTEQGLKNVNTSIFNGFTTLSGKIDEQGKSIVVAMNNNGELLRLQIDETGKLLSTSLLNSTDAIVKAINDQTKSLEERFAILDASLKAGFTDVKVSVDKNTGAITLLDKNTNASLEKINGSLTNGFKLLKEQISTTGNDVIYALDNNGNLLRVELGKQQEALSATIVGQTTKLIAAINDQTSTLDKRIKALSTVVETGLKNVVVSVDKNTGAITLLDKNTQVSLNGINMSLGKIDGTLISGFQAIKTEISTTGGNIVTALDKNGNLLRLELDKQQKLLSATIVTQTNKLAKAINDQTASLSSRFKALTIALSTGLVGIMLEIDKNTGAIKTLDTNTQASLGTLNTTILNGFNKLNETVDDKGNKIVTAIGTQTDAIGTQTEAIKKQGKLLRMTITKSGKLIAAEIVGSIDTLNATLESQNALLESKLDAINTAISSGLAKVTAQERRINRTLDLRLTAIDTQLQGTNTELQNANVQLKTLNTTLKKLNKNLVSGFKTVKNSINKMSGELSVKLADNTTAIVNMEGSMKDNLKSLKDAVDKQGGDIVTAIDKNGKVVATAIDKNGNVISTAIVGVVDAITKQTADLNKAITDGTASVVASNGKLKTAIEDAIKSLENKQDANAKTQIDLLKKMLADNGIYKIPGDNSSIYVDPRLWEAIQYTDLGGVIANMLTVAEEPSLYYSAAYAIRDNELDNVSIMITFEKIGNGPATLAAGTLQPMDLANGKQVIRVTKVIPYIAYRFTSSDKKIVRINYIDSNGKLAMEPDAKEVTKTFVTYANGIITPVVKCNIYLEPNATVTSIPDYTWPE
jgi:lipoprotein